MAESVQRIEIDVQANTSQAQSGMDRLASACARVNIAITQNTSASKQNAKETSKTAQEHKKAGNAARHHASGLKRLAAALKRILIYRAIRGAIKAVTTAMNEGIQRMYEWSKANDQVFMRVMDTYATEVQYLKDAIGAALAPLIEMLMPHLVQLVDWFVELINVVNQFFRALAGYDTWLKVEKVAKSYGEEADKAAKAQKALNIQLMDFDQLNNLTTPKSSGRTEEETPPLTGHYVDIDPKIKEFAERFKKMLAPLEGIKKTLSEIWDIVKPLIAEFALGTLDTVGKILEKVDEVFASLKDSGVFDALGRLFSDTNNATWELVQKVFDAIGLVITKLSETGALTKLIDAINKVSVGGIEHTVSLIQRLVDSGALDIFAYGLSDLFSAFSSVLGMVDDVAGFTTDIANIFLPSIIGSGSSGLSFIAGLLETISGTVSGIIGMVKSLLGMSDESMWTNFTKTIKGMFIEPLLGLVKTIVAIAETIDKTIHGNTPEIQKKWEDVHKWLAESDKWVDELPGKVENAVNKVEGSMEDLTGKAYLHSWKVSNEIEEISKRTQENIGRETDNAMQRLRKLYDDGKIAPRDYFSYLRTLMGGVEKDTLDTINKINREWDKVAHNGLSFGKTFREGFVSEIRKLNNTQIVMQPGQQGNWNKTKVTVQAYADGGFPDMGSMFVAGESGAEMVGSINGRTGVVSGDEISGIASAVYGTGAEEAALLRELIGAVKTQRLTISPSASLGKVVNQSTRLYSGVTG